MLEKILITSFLVFAINATMWEGMIFEGIQKFYWKLMAKWGVSEERAVYWSKPIFGCPICQTPWYGTVIFILIWPWNVKIWLVTIIGAMGLNAILTKLFPPED
jgi:hypothetical protein